VEAEDKTEGNEGEAIINSTMIRTAMTVMAIRNGLVRRQQVLIN